MSLVRILIVEDEVLVAMSMEGVLSDAGHEVIGTAADTCEALTLALGRPDLALVDLNLADGPTGPSIAGTLVERWGTRVLFLTANPRQLGRGVPGALGVIEKPVTNDALLAAVEFVAGDAGAEPPRGFQPFAGRVSLAS